MSEHLIIYLDESGDLGFDFDDSKPSRFFVIAILICLGNQANKSTIQAVKRTLRNKLPKNTQELKGSRLKLAIKQHFLKGMQKFDDWCLYAAIADKKTWIAHHNSKNNGKLKKRVLYDEVAKRVFSQVDLFKTAHRVDIVIDRSKPKKDVLEFNRIVQAVIKSQLPKGAALTMRHAYSHEEAGLQAIDLFCAGIWRKHEKDDVVWYAEFSDKIASEVEYKF